MEFVYTAESINFKIIVTDFRKDGRQYRRVVNYSPNSVKITPQFIWNTKDKSEVMSGENKRRSRKNIKKQDKVEDLSAVQEISEHETSEHGDAVAKMNSQDHTEALRAGLANISKDIKYLKQEIRHELTTLKDELKKEMKEESLIFNKK